MKEHLVQAMQDMLQKNITCNYVIRSNDQEKYYNETLAIDAYLAAYELSRKLNKDVQCYMAPDGTPASMPVFEVISGNVYLSGQLIYQPQLDARSLDKVVLMYRTFMIMRRQYSGSYIEITTN